MSDLFSLSDCDVIGFDLDHTLCRYRLQESSKLIYDSFAQYLVAEKGYTEDLLSVTTEEWDFCSKGLVLDLEEGNFLKLAADGTILRACHGTKTMTAEMIAEIYGEKRVWKHFKEINGTYARSAKYYFYDNYFDLPGALLCAKIVDSLEMTDEQSKYDFWKDVISAVEHNYKTTAFKENCGTYFPTVKKDPGKYLKSCPDSVKNWIRSLKNAGKTILLITSSHSDYCRLLCEYIFGKDFEELFDIIITNALKPGFFSLTPQQRPFWTLESDIEIDRLPTMEKAGWYSQGNWLHLYNLLKKMTGKPEPKSLQPQEPYSVSKKWGSYFADSIPGTKSTQEIQTATWCCISIRDYSTITIPSIMSIVDLPLDHKFPRFSSNNSDTDGFYPHPPAALLSQNKEGAAA
ncbi:5'-nucleotidase domain-containing protein 1 isoform X2 [Mixophyes fleayi]|uniref:5'-nucleotidase domain-containing protein 1 isoform X2 n=1 Tax=Mixophyes fleayi TaxID=3061075 RepID=UPI003F4E412D